MTHRTQHFLWFIILLNTTHLCNALITGTKIIPRSQSVNAARQMVGWYEPFWGINRLPQDKCYTSFNLIAEYASSFHSFNLASFFFGDAMQNPCTFFNPIQGFTVSGSAVTDRGSTDWLADYFGLPRDFQSFVVLQPQIKTFTLDFAFYVGLDAWLNGLYFRIQGPYAYSQWGFDATETISSNQSGSLSGTIGYFQGYFSSNVVPPKISIEAF